MPLEPMVVSGFVGIEVVEHDVDGGVGPSGDNVVHEVEELNAPPLLVGCRHLAGGHLETESRCRCACNSGYDLSALGRSAL
jgi:hypothetical protein